MSIKHFEDLTLDEIIDALALDWDFTEKLDGSYLEFGLDDRSKFFTRRKNGKPCYTIDDWPPEGWTRSYRLAHSIAECVVDLLKSKKIIQPGDFIKSEVLYGEVPNTVYYNNQATLAITGVSRSGLGVDIRNCFSDFKAISNQNLISSPDGVALVHEPIHQIWRVIYPAPLNRHFILARLGIDARTLQNWLINWLAHPSKVKTFTNRECLEVKLNKRPDTVPASDWAQVKIQLRDTREELRETLKSQLLIFKNIALSGLVNDLNSTVGIGSSKEGAVVITDGGTLFKITDREEFTKANRLTHIVKYWLVGGRRPARPSFLSRTKHWSIDDRLARLDQLRMRYLLKHNQLYGSYLLGGKQFYVRYEGELHERMKILFADVKNRIENGR